ncbi:MAG TPA: peptidoglycan DD-metalloendopeptidase family protein [Caulobacteraceae bacterium]|jgi:septal ring factor EnvC (AmiA/AmiB activator)|nr:peptidoglycan DD-metalloendopeptidase family protein [Caulobacteraceae bacterium]
MRRVPPLLAILLLTVPAAAQAPADPRALDGEIEKLRGELVKLGAAEQAGEGTAMGQRARLIELNAEEAALKARIGANRDDLSKLLAALQTYQRRPPPPLLVNPRSARDAVRAAILIRAVTPALEARGKAFAAQAEAIAKVRRSAAAASETLFQAESDIADRRGEIDRLTAQKRGLEQKVYADTGAPDPRTRELALRAGSVEEFVHGLAGHAPAQPPPTAPPEQMTSPVQGVLVRRFGELLEGQERSQGWTWRAAPAAAVVAPAPGRVEYAGPLKGWGQVMILNIGGDRRLVLAGMDAVLVGIGRAVAAGEPVGRLGPGSDKGRTPPELYLEVRGGAGALNPARWLKLAAQTSVTPFVRR